MATSSTSSCCPLPVTRAQERYEKRQGGYTRIIRHRVAPSPGQDNAPRMANSSSWSEPPCACRCPPAFQYPRGSSSAVAARQKTAQSSLRRGHPVPVEPYALLDSSNSALAAVAACRTDSGRACGRPGGSLIDARARALDIARPRGPNGLCSNEPAARPTVRVPPTAAEVPVARWANACLPNYWPTHLPALTATPS